MTAHTAITAQDAAGQKAAARCNLTLDECRAIVDAGTPLSRAVWSRDTQVNALFALSGKRVTKVGL